MPPLRRPRSRAMRRRFSNKLRPAAKGKRRPGPDADGDVQSRQCEDDQKAKIADITKDAMAKARDIRDDATLSDDDKREKTMAN